MHVTAASALQATRAPAQSGRTGPAATGSPRSPGLPAPAAEEALGRVVRLAARLLRAPVAWLAVPCGENEELAARVGLLPSSIPAEHGIAARVPPAPDILVVPDLSASESWDRHPLASAGFGMRFLAAVAIPGPDGLPPAALCVGGPLPRVLEPEDEAALRDLAALAGAEAARLGADALCPRVPGSDARSGDARDRRSGRAWLAQDMAALAAGQGNTGHLAVLVDLDRAVRAAEFMGVPDCSGEDLLGKAAGVIAAVLPPAATLYRLDGARFAFLLPEAGHRAVLNRLAGALRVPVACGTVPLLLAPRIGAAPFVPGTRSDTRSGTQSGHPPVQHSVDPLLRAAAAAAHGVPGTGGHEGWSLYDAEADRVQARALRLLSDLHPALGARDPGRAGRIALHYQPRVDLRTGRCAAAEALLRWQHPVLGGVPPGELMPLVERTALPRALTNWVLEQALADAARWRAEGYAHGPAQGTTMGVSVNVSAPNLAEPDFVSRIGQILDRYRLPPDMLELELTEDALLHGAGLRRTLGELSRLGVVLAIDDFGTGYSNLAYLQRLPVTVLKLDRGFVRSLPNSERDRTIVQSLIAMAHALDLRVVAEGVEDESTLALLREWSCDEAQGFLFSPALPLDALPSWVAANDRSWAIPQV